MDRPIPYYSPEIWGGIECTINRINDDYIDQLHQAGHYGRTDDLDQLASLGIRKMRYPILWEKHQPERDAVIDWQWTEQRLEQLRNKKVEVIAGLVHHGSGPAFTHLADENFPYLLASYARQVAERFPWIEYYTPVNEPLTTARFSGLYGIWYPHYRNTRSFVQMLLNQLKGVVLSMQEIRKVNPAAKLVQTEDLGKTYSTPTLKYQADFENERRWLTFDILCGRLNDGHPLWKHFQKLGIPRQDLDFFQENPCPPDIFGFNHYVTSERYLDDRLDLYPAHTHGGNGRHHYADVEAVRVNLEEETGIGMLLKEAWDRFHCPMAVTEVHLHCYREEQLRWFKYMWQTVNKLKREGIDIRGITSWALLGSYGWNSLLTKPDGDYEPGAFDLRGGRPRPTALAHYIREIAHNNNDTHRLSEEKGWWQRETRILYTAWSKTIQMTANNEAPLLIIGKNGTLGRAFAKVCQERCINYHLLSRQDCDISDLRSVEAAIDHYQPWAIINAAGYVRVDDAEDDAAACMRDNTTGPRNLAIACHKYGVRLVSFSSDLVFDGQKAAPYGESDRPNPVNVYGRSKAHAEQLVGDECPSALIIRTSAFFGPWDEYNFAHHIRRSLSHYEPVTVAHDLYISPTYVPHLVHTALDLLIDGESGLWHLANDSSLSWSEFAHLIAEGFGLDHSLIHSVSVDEMDYRARRPANSSLASDRGQLLPSLSSAMNEYLQAKRAYRLKAVG